MTMATQEVDETLADSSSDASTVFDDGEVFTPDDEQELPSFWTYSTPNTRGATVGQKLFPWWV